MKIVLPVSALFCLVLHSQKQTALLIGSITVTPFVVKHICFSFSALVIKRVTYFACIDYRVACLLDPPSLE